MLLLCNLIYKSFNKQHEQLNHLFLFFLFFFHPAPAVDFVCKRVGVPEVSCIIFEKLFCFQRKWLYWLTVSHPIAPHLDPLPHSDAFNDQTTNPADFVFSAATFKYSIATHLDKHRGLFMFRIQNTHYNWDKPFLTRLSARVAPSVRSWS